MFKNDKVNDIAKAMNVKPREIAIRIAKVNEALGVKDSILESFEIMAPLLKYNVFSNLAKGKEETQKTVLKSLGVLVDRHRIDGSIKTKPANEIREEVKSYIDELLKKGKTKKDKELKIEKK